MLIILYRFNKSITNIQLLRPVHRHVLRSADRTRKLARHRNLFTGNGQQTLPRRFTKQRLPKYARRRQQISRLAHLRGFCTTTDCPSQNSLHQRRLRCGTRSISLRSRRHDYRSMSVAVPLGSLSQTQRSDKTSYTDGPERQHSMRYYVSQTAKRTTSDYSTTSSSNPVRSTFSTLLKILPRIDVSCSSISTYSATTYA